MASRKINIQNYFKLTLVVLIFLAVGLRICFLLKSGYEFDIGQFIKWGSAISQNGFWSVYSRAGVSQVDSYPPLIPLFTAAWLNAGKFFHLANGDQLKIFFKILPTIFELGLIVITARYVWLSKIKYKIPLLFVVILSPSLSFVTSAWGQAEAVFVLFILLGFILADNNPSAATLMMYLALLSKPQVLPAILIYFVYLFARNKFNNALKQLLLFLILVLLGEAVFRRLGSISLVGLFTGSLGFYKNISLNAFNLWWLIHGPSTWNILDNGPGLLNYKNIGLALLVIFELPALFYFFYRKRSLPEAMLALAYTYLVFFVFPTEIHERYLYPAVAFFALAAILNYRFFVIYLILSATYLVNVFAVLQSVYPQFGVFWATQGNLLNSGWTRFVALINLAVVVYLAMFLLNDKTKKS